RDKRLLWEENLDREQRCSRNPHAGSARRAQLARAGRRIVSKENVLFVCIHNSARSQMAEAFLNDLCPDHFAAHSAGLEPGSLNPVVVEAMREVGLDISRNRTKSVDDVLKSGKTFAHVITVCDQTSAERCPIFPGAATRLHWSFPDPS